jgi:hypothetical protein
MSTATSKHLPLHGADELALRAAELGVQATQGSADGVGVLEKQPNMETTGDAPSVVRAYHRGWIPADVDLSGLEDAPLA